MKKKIVLLLSLISSLGIVSCGTSPRYDEAILIQYAASITPATYTKFTATGEGHALEVEEVDKTLRNIAVSGSTSMFLSLPLKIDAGEFYYVDSKDEMNTSCQFYQIFTVLVDTSCYNATNNYIDANGSLVLEAFSSNNQLSIKNVFDEVSRLNARWNLRFVYNNEGYLIEESIASINDVKDPSTQTVKLISTYEYE